MATLKKGKEKLRKKLKVRKYLDFLVTSGRKGNMTPRKRSGYQKLNCTRLVRFPMFLLELPPSLYSAVCSGKGPLLSWPRKGGTELFFGLRWVSGGTGGDNQALPSWVPLAACHQALPSILWGIEGLTPILSYPPFIPMLLFILGGLYFPAHWIWVWSCDLLWPLEWGKVRGFPVSAHLL